MRLVALVSLLLSLAQVAAAVLLVGGQQPDETASAMLVAATDERPALGSPSTTGDDWLAGDQPADRPHGAGADRRRSSSLDEADYGLGQLSTKQPRQQFRVHLGPSAPAKRRAPLKGLVQSAARRKQAASAEAERHARRSPQVIVPATGEESKPSISTSKKQQQQPQPKKISGATLKKLLGQTLPKYAGGSQPNGTAALIGGGGPTTAPQTNFKFVFIQRATAAPPQARRTATTPQAAAASAASSAAAPTGAAQDSLAASVSKQLASSLLYSAANLIGASHLTAANLTKASISSLVSQVYASSPPTLAAPITPPERPISAAAPASTLASTTTTTTTTTTPAAPSPTTAAAAAATDAVADPSETTNELRRISSAAPPFVAATTAKQGRTSPAAKFSGAKKSRPSKVYNLPLKLVANGQPSGGLVLVQTLRNHLATIKKYQQSSSGSLAQGHLSPASGGGGKRRKHQQHNKLKGTNSRLIYLPLRFMSNARPSYILGGGGAKASHKAAN